MWIDNSEMGMSFGMSLARGVSSSIQCGIPRKNTNRNHRKIITINDPLGHSEWARASFADVIFGTVPL